MLLESIVRILIEQLKKTSNQKFSFKKLNLKKVHCINLDPAAETIEYPVSIDIRDLITVDEVMEELNYGPNGGNVFCF